MFIKTSAPTDWNLGLDEPVVQRIKVSSRGLIGHDRKEFLKRASATALESFKNAEFRPGEIPIHLIALGATEFYNGNRNGDGFKVATCRQHHDSFVKLGRWYRHHKNTPTSDSYGRIVKSAFNEDMARIELLCGLNGTKQAADANKGFVADEEMGMLDSGKAIPVSMACKIAHDVCFSADAFVETRTGSRRITEIGVGDIVKTHTGAWHPVLETMCRDYAGDTVDLDVVGIPDSIRCTANHPFLVVRREQVADCRGETNGKGGQHAVRKGKTAGKRRHTVRDGGSCSTCRKTVTAPPSWETAESIKPGDLLVYPVVKPGKTEVSVAHAYLAGMYVGDGCLIRTRRGARRDGPLYVKGFAVTLDHSNPDILARFLAYASSLHGRQQPYGDSGNAKKSWCAQVHARQFATWLQITFGEYSTQKRIPDVVFSWDEPARLAFLAGLTDSDGSVDRNRRYGSGRHTTINRTLACSIQQLWWGLGVPAGLHWQEMKSAYGAATGKVVCFTVSVPRSGVALIAGLSVKSQGITAPTYRRTLGFLLGGYMHLPVSRLSVQRDSLPVYNLRVAVDESYIVGVAVHNCSVCHNKARTRNEYCGDECPGGGCKKNIGKLVKVGNDMQLLHVDNPNPAWFDISKVYKPADRIAYGGGLTTKSAAFREEIAGNAVPMRVLLESIDTLGTEENKLVAKLAACLAGVEPTAEETSRFSRAFRPDDALVKAASHDRTCLTAMARRNVVLSLSQFALFTNREKLASSAQLLLQDALLDVTQTGRLNSKWARLEPNVTPEASRIAEKAARSWGLDLAGVSKRAALDVLRNDDEPGMRKQAGFTLWSKEAAELADDYTAYSLAAFAAIGQQTPDLYLTAILGRVQNQLM